MVFLFKKENFFEYTTLFLLTLFFLVFPNYASAVSGDVTINTNVRFTYDLHASGYQSWYNLDSNDWFFSNQTVTYEPSTWGTDPTTETLWYLTIHDNPGYNLVSVTPSAGWHSNVGGQNIVWDVVWAAIVPTASISASPSNLNYAETSTVTWSSTNATSCEAGGTWPAWQGAIALSGTATYNPTFSHTLSVTCTGSNGSATDSVSVTVGAAPAPTVDFKVNGSDTTVSVPDNSTATVSWTSTNATSCTASGDRPEWQGPVALSSSGISYTVDKHGETLGVTCTGAGGSVTDQIIVNITPPTVDLDVNSSDGPVSVDYAETTSVSWTSSNADSCTAGGTWPDWQGSISTSGTSSYNPTSSHSLNVTCTNPGGSTTDTVSVTVGAEPNYPPYGWLDSADCDLIGGWAYDPNVPSEEIQVHIYADGPAGSGTWLGAFNTDGYRADVNSSNGITGNHGFTMATPLSVKDRASHTIYVHAIDSSGNGPNDLLQGVPKTITCDPPPPEVSITCDPSQISHNTSSTITWSSSYTNSCTVTPGGWTGLSGSEDTGNLIADTTYTVTCSGL